MNKCKRTMVIWKATSWKIDYRNFNSELIEKSPRDNIPIFFCPSYINYINMPISI